MGGVYECPICEHHYDPEGRRPLCLPCGHTVCKTCLLRSISLSMKMCPICRKVWTGCVDDLPVCYQLIPGTGTREEEHSRLSPQDTHDEGGRCKEHSYDYEFWCSTCHWEVCKKCLIERHKTCKTVLIEDLVASTSLTHVVDASTFLQSILSADMSATRTAISKTLESLTTVNRLLNVVSSVKGELEAEQVYLSNHRDYIEKLKRDVTQTPVERTTSHKRQMLRWATDYHCNLGTTQPTGNFSALQLQRLKELCTFAKSFQFPRREQQQRRGWFGGWW